MSAWAEKPECSQNMWAAPLTARGETCCVRAMLQDADPQARDESARVQGMLHYWDRPAHDATCCEQEKRRRLVQEPLAWVVGQAKHLADVVIERGCYFARPGQEALKTMKVLAAQALGCAGSAAGAEYVLLAVEASAAQVARRIHPSCPGANVY